MERKMTVMAVDDSLVSLLAIKKHLADSMYALNVDIYSETQPDIVLLDIVMPEIDGVTLLKQLRQLDENATVVMVSSLASKEKVMECIDEGATSFLMKPYNRDTLMKTLAAAAAAALVKGDGNMEGGGQ